MNPYNILGIPPHATEEEIKKAYRQKAAMYHPDRNIGDKSAETKFKEVVEAYETLTNRKKPQQTGFPFPDFFNDFFSFHNVNPKRGRDIYTECTIDFIQSFTGCETEVNLPRGEQCEKCKGSCAEPDGIIICTECNGQGVVTYKSGNMTVRTTCQDCAGSGKKIIKICTNCNGEGLTKNTSSIKINIPAGIKSGDKIRISGQGEQKNTPGDAVVQINVKEHKLFYREEDDLKLKVPITYYQAVFGGEIEIPTLNGNKTIEIPPESNTGDEIRLSNLGFPNVRSRRCGDCIAVLEIDTSLPNKKYKSHIQKMSKFEESEKIKEFNRFVQP